MFTQKKSLVLKTLNIKTLSYFAMLGIISHAQAETTPTKEEDTKRTELRYLGVVGGVNSAVGEAVAGELKPTFGLTLGANVAPGLGIGFLGTYYGERSSGSFLGIPTSTATSTLLLVGQLKYNVKGFHVGADIGAAIGTWYEDVAKFHAEKSTAAMIIGPEIGYDFIVDDSISLGGEVHYLVNFEKTDVRNVQALIALKFWQ